MNDDKKVRIPWSTLIIGIIIYVLFMLWTGQRNENEKAKQVFAEQTARAENQLAATKQIEDKVKDCVETNRITANTLFAYPDCAFGYIYSIEEMETGPSEPKVYLTFFSPMPNTFYLYGGYAPWGYVDDCVKVWGKIAVDSNGVPAMYINEYGDNLEKLPDDICRQ